MGSNKGFSCRLTPTLAKKQKPTMRTPRPRLTKAQRRHSRHRSSSPSNTRQHEKELAEYQFPGLKGSRREFCRASGPNSSIPIYFQTHEIKTGSPDQFGVLEQLKKSLPLPFNLKLSNALLELIETAKPHPILYRATAIVCVQTLDFDKTSASACIQAHLDRIGDSRAQKSNRAVTHCKNKSLKVYTEFGGWVLSLATTQGAMIYEARPTRQLILDHASKRTVELIYKFAGGAPYVASVRLCSYDYRCFPKTGDLSIGKPIPHSHTLAYLAWDKEFHLTAVEQWHNGNKAGLQVYFHPLYSGRVARVENWGFVEGGRNSATGYQIGFRRNGGVKYIHWHSPHSGKLDGYQLYFEDDTAHSERYPAQDSWTKEPRRSSIQVFPEPVYWPCSRFPRRFLKKRILDDPLKKRSPKKLQILRKWRFFADGKSVWNTEGVDHPSTEHILHALHAADVYRPIPSVPLPSVERAAVQAPLPMPVPPPAIKEPDCDNWRLTDIEVKIVKKGFRNDVFEGKVGVIKRVYPGSTCAVLMLDEKELITVPGDYLSAVGPGKRDKIKFIHGKLAGQTGQLLGLDGNDGIVKMDNDALDIRVVPLGQLAKLAGQSMEIPFPYNMVSTDPRLQPYQEPTCTSGQV